VAAVTDINTIIEQGLAHVRKRIRVEAAYLFGSQVTGKAHEDSDIDLAIFTPDVETLNLVERVHLTSEIALGCDSNLELHLMPSRALAEARPSNFAGYIVAHGKRLI
jgi:predicted nucleotidyltransferase